MQQNNTLQLCVMTDSFVIQEVNWEVVCEEEPSSAA